ncbi:GntR family transcriptional regulator [Streptomyces nymphaeiformis]|uniref:GntR family transcriptional regulator n=1 Tax=Streptomyces nymphaeiformis TaxID=2663842 RepID=A0A7W7XA38_9ACTN|nr:GntR family transcriptional regulator [Streptomyces nymphaeiformis]MBB4979728.1 GntR family transcriptional regulator [Streptomyces nymphaeiformis]
MISAVASRRHVIADDLRAQISTGRIKAGDRLPSEAQLAARYTVSTPTLRSALALLQAEGLVEKVHGKGNFVRPPLHRITYLGGSLTPPAPGLQISIRTTKIRARGHLSVLLRVPAGSPLTEFQCLSHDGTSPHSLSRVYIPRDLAPAVVSAESTWPTTMATPLAEVEERLCARLPTPVEAATLRISPTLAVLAITRVATDTAGRVVEAALLALPGDCAEAVFTTHPTSEDRRAEG